MTSASSGFVGRISFDSGRELQDEQLRKCLSGSAFQSYIFCEHPPTITLGRRTKEGDINLSDKRFQNFEIKTIDRAGGATYHGPGQLILYPTIPLRERRMGVKRAIDELLFSVAELLSEYGVSSERLSFCPPGVWIDYGNHRRKIASIGLRIVSGVTTHGISLNVNNDLEPFGWFSPCGMENCAVTSLSNILVNEKFSLETVSGGWKSHLTAKFDT